MTKDQNYFAPSESQRVIYTEAVSCYVCHGTGWLRLGRSAVSSCYACEAGTSGLQTHTEIRYYTEGLTTAIWTQDPFQNGAHTTVPAWYVVRQLQHVFARNGMDLPPDDVMGADRSIREGL